jgi:hypothetical protein
MMPGAAVAGFAPIMPGAEEDRASREHRLATSEWGPGRIWRVQWMALAKRKEDSDVAGGLAATEFGG